MRPSVYSPQQLGTQVVWNVSATDSNPNPVSFQFNVAYGNGPFSVVQDFRAGSLGSAGWIAWPFAWTSIKAEGPFQIQVIAKDFVSGETASKTVPYYLTSRVTSGIPTVTATSNPLVALFSAPPCPAGNSMRVTFQPPSGVLNTTNWQPCAVATSMNFYIAGMFANTTYTMNYQLMDQSKSHIAAGAPQLCFTTGSVPSTLAIPSLQTNITPGPQTDTADSIILHDFLQPNFPVATDMEGRLLWYYTPGVGAILSFIPRPLSGGTMITYQNGIAGNPAATFQQILRVVDLAGNAVVETNTGSVQQQLVAMGASDMGPCNVHRVTVGTGCLTGFYHDAILLPNGNIATIAVVEKVFPPGTQGDQSGLPVDIVGDGIVVLNPSMQVVWYWDAFQHAGGATQLDINRAAVLNETCTYHSLSCPAIQLLIPGVTSPTAYDWLHSNSLYFVPSTGDLVLSIDHQDWVVKIDFKNGTGTGNILWRMGQQGDFAFNNVTSDAWPWFSHQHEVSFANSGAAPMILIDNGNARIAANGGGNSRGMALNVNESTMTVTPVLSVDLGAVSMGQGGAQALSNGSYSFELQLDSEQVVEIMPTAGTTTGTPVFQMTSSPALSYRNWRMPSMYSPGK